MTAERERELVEENLPLVRALAARFSGRAERNDLIQVGTIGLLKAVRNRDPAFGTALSTYAVPLILGEMRRYLRDDRPVHVSRGMKELAAKIVRLRNERGEMRLSELAEELGVTADEAADALNAALPARSLCEPVGDGGTELYELIPDPLDTETAVLNRLFSEELLAALDGRERELMRCRFFFGLTQKETAQRLGLTQPQVSRLEKAALERLRRAADIENF